jgi:hypothetical protein
MFKRILLAATFLGVLGVAGFGLTSTASAYDCDYPTYGYRTAYYPAYVPYYPPRAAAYYYPSPYATFRPIVIDGHAHHHHHDGVTLSIGF